MKPDYGLITTEQELRDLIESLKGSEVLGFDVETGYLGQPQDRGSLNPETGFIVGFSITNSRHWARYVPVRHDHGPNVGNALSLIKPLLQSHLIVAHNAGFERRMLLKEGINSRIKSCTLIEAYCLGMYPEHGLKPLTLEVFGHAMAEITSLWPGIKAKDKKQIRFNDRDQTLPEVIDYACEDAVWCLALHQYHYPMVQSQRHGIYDIEMATMPVVSDMEALGVAVDFARLRDWANEGKAFATLAEKKVIDELIALAKVEDVNALAEIAGSPKRSLFNLNSSQQLRKVLFDHCGFEVTKKTDKGEASTSDVALTTLAKKVPEIEHLLEYRRIKKLIGSYLEKWPRDFGNDKALGRVHPGWKQNGVPAGRFSVVDPPIQTCPKDFEYDINGHRFSGNFRDSVVSAPGFYLLDFDYSQIELRVIAGLSQDPKLLDGFARGLDPHVLTGALVNNKDPDSVTDKERSQGKTFNFALIYQMGKRSLAQRLGVQQRRANLLYSRFFEGYEVLNDWIEEQKFKGTSREYVETYFGRKVPIFEFKYAREHPDPWKSKGLYGHGERLCVNAPVQGTAADIAKQAMFRSVDALKAEGLYPDKARLIINNHDELVYEVHESLTPEHMIGILRPAVEIEVPDLPALETDWVTGTRWGSIQAAIKGEDDE